MIRSEILSTFRNKLFKHNIAFFTFLLKYIYYSIIKSQDLIYKLASSIVKLVPKLYTIERKKVCFNIFIYFFGYSK